MSTDWVRGEGGPGLGESSPIDFKVMKFCGQRTIRATALERKDSDKMLLNLLNRLLIRVSSYI